MAALIARVGRFREMLLELRVTVEVSQRRHPNIVDFLGAAVKFPAASQPAGEWQIGLVFELCDPYDLYHVLHNHKIKLSLQQKLQLARESASGLAYLHSHNILHRDFGSRNLLIKDGHAKLTVRPVSCMLLVSPLLCVPYTPYCCRRQRVRRQRL